MTVMYVDDSCLQTWTDGPSWLYVCLQPRQSSRVLLLLLSLLRLVFLPIFLLSNIIVPNQRLPVVFQTDVVPIVAESLLGFSNGYIATLSMMYGPQ